MLKVRRYDTQAKEPKSQGALFSREPEASVVARLFVTANKKV
jgi:hypothetical protein